MTESNTAVLEAPVATEVATPGKPARTAKPAKKAVVNDAPASSKGKPAKASKAAPAAPSKPSKPAAAPGKPSKPSKPSKPAKADAQAKPATNGDKVDRRKGPRGESERLRCFKLLAANPEGLTGTQVASMLGLPAFPMVLKWECLHPEGARMRRFTREGVRGALFTLTAKGKADLKADKIDSSRAPRTDADWPEGK